MDKYNKNRELDNTDKKLHISDVMYRLFCDYKKSINWFALMVYYIAFTIAFLFDGCTWIRFFGITSVFFGLTFIVWVQHYLLRRNDT